MLKHKSRLTLYSPVSYKIKVSGHLDPSRVEWAENMEITVETDGADVPITTLTSTIDQAALIGILRRLYSLGLPLIMVKWMDSDGM